MPASFPYPCLLRRSGGASLRAPALRLVPSATARGGIRTQDAFATTRLPAQRTGRARHPCRRVRDGFPELRAGMGTTRSLYNNDFSTQYSVLGKIRNLPNSCEP